MSGCCFFRVEDCFIVELKAGTVSNSTTAFARRKLDGRGAGPFGPFLALSVVVRFVLSFFHHFRMDEVFASSSLLDWSKYQR